VRRRLVGVSSAVRNRIIRGEDRRSRSGSKADVILEDIAAARPPTGVVEKERHQWKVHLPRPTSYCARYP
jgi:hypothetical protein